MYAIRWCVRCAEWPCLCVRQRQKLPLTDCSVETNVQQANRATRNGIHVAWGYSRNHNFLFAELIDFVDNKCAYGATIHTQTHANTQLFCIYLSAHQSSPSRQIAFFHADSKSLFVLCNRPSIAARGEKCRSQKRANDTKRCVCARCMTAVEI